MQLQLLQVSECYESETNPRGKEFGGKSFDELVASVKEKGVLVPVLARKMEADGGWYEVIAGNRRLRAAKQAGLKEVPAHLVDMSDDEAREAQIVENLQREDVHPLEEGEAYRQLIEDGGRTVKDVAAKVGKSDTYVRQRLFLTNLSERARKAYRSGDMSDSVAVLVARLSPNNQDQMMKEAWYELRDPSEAKQYIAKAFSKPLEHQPWLKDQKAMEAVGPCKECPPPRSALFGNVKNGACTDMKCWSRKMKAYMEWRVKETPGLLLVSTYYGKPAMPNVLSRSQYEPVKKTSCDFAAPAMIVEGDGLGSLFYVCADPKCDEHHEQHTEYRANGDEKARRKKEREKDEARRKKFDDAIFAALEGVNWPISQRHFDALFGLMLENASTNTTQPLLKRHGLKAHLKKHNGYTERDCATPLRRLAEEHENGGKLRLMFELLLPTYWSQGDDSSMKKKVAKL